MFVVLVNEVHVEASSELVEEMKSELDSYITLNKGLIQYHYVNLVTGEKSGSKATIPQSAASTIKIPLALYYEDLIQQGKVSLKTKLTYKSYHHYGGSGVIQHDPIGSVYAIEDLLNKMLIHSDNIAYIMLREHVGKQHFITYTKKQLGGTYVYPNGRNVTTPKDLTGYFSILHQRAKSSDTAKKLVTWLQETDYNEGIPSGTNVNVAHKVGMIPMYNLSHDSGIVYQDTPYAVAIMTEGYHYETSKGVISEVESLIDQIHVKYEQKDSFELETPATIYSSKQGELTPVAIANPGLQVEPSVVWEHWIGFNIGDQTFFVKRGQGKLEKRKPSIQETSPPLATLRMEENQEMYKSADLQSEVVMVTTDQMDLPVVKQLEGGYVVMINGNEGVVKKQSGEIVFHSFTTHFITQDHVPVYGKESDQLHIIGTLAKGYVFERVREYGPNWHEIQFGEKSAYVKIAQTIPSLELLIESNIEGKIEVKEGAQFYQYDLPGSEVVVSSEENMIVPFIQKVGPYYNVEVSGLSLFVHRSDVLSSQE